MLLQDSKSAILLEQNGRQSAGERTQALNIQYFMVTNHISKGDLSVKYCPTNSMLGDYFTKPLQGRKFKEFQRRIMGIV